METEGLNVVRPRAAGLREDENRHLEGGAVVLYRDRGRGGGVEAGEAVNAQFRRRGNTHNARHRLAARTFGKHRLCRAEAQG